MAKTPWGGRFKVGVDDLMRRFSESVSYDRRLIDYDLTGSVAHARMLGETGIVTREEAGRLVAGLEEIRRDHEAGRIEFDPALEDVHMNVESILRSKVGEVAGKLHTARSRNDQINLDMRLYLKDAIEAAMDGLAALCRALAGSAEENIGAIMPGYTHTRKAQPVPFSHHLLAYVEMFLRDRGRMEDCRRRMDLCPLGSGALAGTTFPIDREMTARELGFAGVTQNSMDAVGDRDFLLEFLSAASIAMVHLSRLMEELIWWGLPEIGFVSLPESFCTGSSMMPNKMNPDAAELVRGKTGRVIGSLNSLLVIMKGTPLAYNRDLQEDKEGTFDASDTLIDCLLVTERLVAGMKIDAERMRRACSTGFVLATDLADYLAGRGVPFRDAHEVSGKLVRHCEERGVGLEDLSLSELRSFSGAFEEDVKDWLSLEASVNRRSLVGGAATSEVARQIQRLKTVLEPL